MDLQEEAATKVVADYNEKGRRAMPQKDNRRPYDDYRDRRRRGRVLYIVFFSYQVCPSKLVFWLVGTSIPSNEKISLSKASKLLYQENFPVVNSFVFT